MRDGKHLAADLYLPAKRGRYPAVLIQTPYNKDNLGAPISTGKSDGGEVGRGAVSDTLGLLDRDRYAYVVVDWRGFYASKEAMEGVQRGRWRRGQDGYDCVEWIAAQPWSDGKVGTWGGSALGKQQFDTAAEKPPHLVCAVPLIATMGQSYGGYYDGEVYREAHVKTLDALGYGVSKFALDNPLPDTPTWRAVERLTYRPDLVDVPCLFITGWWDHYPGDVIRNFEDLVARGGPKAREHSKILIGPWDHVSVGLAEQGGRRFDGAARASAEAAKAFFDRWLRGVENNGWDRTPRVRYWVINEEGWRDAEAWSAVSKGTRTLHLTADGRLAAVQGADEPRGYLYDPKSPPPTLGGANLPPLKHGPTDQTPLGARKDVLAYTTGPLDPPLRILGEIEIVLDVEADRPSFDMIVRVCDVRDDGKAWLLADAARRTRDAKPGERVRVTLRVPPTAAAVRELRIYVSSGNWPRYERNPHTGDHHWDAAKALPLSVRIHGGRVRVPGGE
jgi:predicted acyl esterase